MGFLRKKDRSKSSFFPPESRNPTKIHVVKFKSGTAKYPVRVRTKTVDLTRAEYTALSYVKDAGSDLSQPNNESPSRNQQSAATSTILCDGSSLQVSMNLRNALSELLDIRSEFPIWVDTLCTNLNNKAERAADTSLTSHIYGRASYVVVWLGRHPAPTKEVVLIMRKLVNAIDWRKVSSDVRYDFRDPRIYQHLAISPISRQQWDNVFAFCNVRWFSQLWSFYQLASASEIMFLFGDSRMDFQFLSDFAKVLELTGWLDAAPQRGGTWSEPMTASLTKMMNLIAEFRAVPIWHPRHAEHVPWMRQEYGLESESQRAWKFFEILLQMTEEFRCDDRRDYIFAPLSLVRKIYFGKPVNREWPLVDYSTSVETLYTNFANLILRHTLKPSILSAHIPQHFSQMQLMNGERPRTQRKPIDTMRL